MTTLWVMRNDRPSRWPQNRDVPKMSISPRRNAHFYGQHDPKMAANMAQEGQQSLLEAIKSLLEAILDHHGRAFPKPLHPLSKICRGSERFYVLLQFLQDGPHEKIRKSQLLPGTREILEDVSHGSSTLGRSRLKYANGVGSGDISRYL